VGKYGTVEQATDDNAIRCMRIACRLPKATNTHSEYVIFIVSQPAMMVARARLDVKVIRILPV